MAHMALDQAWVVCHDETRLVVRRAVVCPLRGRVPASVCMGCRHLVTSSGERARDRWCGTGEPVARRWALEDVSAHLDVRDDLLTRAGMTL